MSSAAAEQQRSEYWQLLTDHLIAKGEFDAAVSRICLIAAELPVCLNWPHSSVPNYSKFEHQVVRLEVY